MALNAIHPEFLYKAICFIMGEMRECEYLINIQKYSEKSNHHMHFPATAFY